VSALIQKKGSKNKRDTELKVRIPGSGAEVNNWRGRPSDGSGASQGTHEAENRRTPVLVEPRVKHVRKSDPDADVTIDNVAKGVAETKSKAAREERNSSGIGAGDVNIHSTVEHGGGVSDSSAVHV
jgi:hypothetical protein